MRTLKRFLRQKLIDLIEYQDMDPARWGGLGEGAELDRQVFVSNPENVVLGARVSIYRGSKIFCGNGRVELGDDSHFAGDVYVNCAEGNLVIGRGVAVGPKTVFVTFSNHHDGEKPVSETYRQGDIRVGDDVFIGAGAVILPGVEIGNGAIVGAGAVVNKNIEAGAIVGGVPARTISQRG